MSVIVLSDVIIWPKFVVYMVGNGIYPYRPMKRKNGQKKRKNEEPCKAAIWTSKKGAKWRHWKPPFSTLCKGHAKEMCRKTDGFF